MALFQPVLHFPTMSLITILDDVKQALTDAPSLDISDDQQDQGNLDESLVESVQGYGDFEEAMTAIKRLRKDGNDQQIDSDFVVRLAQCESLVARNLLAGKRVIGSGLPV